jgi:peptidoglycan hydrolase CwlO-like protein
MNDSRKISLSAKLLVCTHTVRDLITQIKKIEDDVQAPANEKLSKIKMIREEITKVGMEIDKLKKEIMLLGAYSIN